MTYIFRFPFGSSELKIKTEEEISDENAKKIALLLQTFQKELNHNIIGSSAYDFNEAPLGVPFLSKTEFIKFLDLNIKLSRSLDLKYNAFHGDYDSFEDFEDLFSIDENTNMITKRKDVVLNSTDLRTHFVIDILVDYLFKELHLANFLILTNNTFTAIGSKEWPLEIIDAKEKVIGIKNEMLLIENFDDEDDRANKFGVIDKQMMPRKLILTSDSAVQNKIALINFPKLRYEYEFQKHAKINNINFLIVDRANNIYEFSGS